MASTPSAEIAALLLTNRRLSFITIGLAILCLTLVASLVYMTHLNRGVKYTTISSGVSLAMPGELDEVVVSQFAESVMLRLGNVGPESIDGVSTWVMRRAHASMRARFRAWLDNERSLIKSDDLSFKFEDPKAINIKKVSTIGEPRYRLVVRGLQTISVGSSDLPPRMIDIPIMVSVGPVDHGFDLVIESLEIPALLTIDGAVISVTGAKESS